MEADDTGWRSADNTENLHQLLFAYLVFGCFFGGGQGGREGAKITATSARSKLAGSLSEFLRA